TRKKFARFLERRRQQAIGSGDTGAHERLDEKPSHDHDLETAWDREYEQQLFRLAAEQIRDSFAPATWQAFWQTAVEGKSGAAVAAGLGISVGAVYVAKSRVMARLTQQVQELQGD